MAKIKMPMTLCRDNSLSIEGAFALFLVDCSARGLAEKTSRTYRQHFNGMGRHLDLTMPLAQLRRSHINDMIVEMRKEELSPNTISSYVRVLTTFLHWCDKEGYCHVEPPKFKQVETVKETYSDEELLALLRRPSPILADDNHRIHTRYRRCTGTCAGRQSRLDCGVYPACHPKNGKGCQETCEGHNHVLRSIAGRCGKELWTSGGSGSDRCIFGSGIPVPCVAVPSGRPRTAKIRSLFCRAGNPRGDYADPSAVHARQIPESGTVRTGAERIRAIQTQRGIHLLYRRNQSVRVRFHRLFRCDHAHLQDLYVRIRNTPSYLCGRNAGRRGRRARIRSSV